MAKRAAPHSTPRSTREGRVLRQPASDEAPAAAARADFQARLFRHCQAVAASGDGQNREAGIKMTKIIDRLFARPMINRRQFLTGAAASTASLLAQSGYE